MTTIYAVCVKPSSRKTICTDGLIWVKDAEHDMYVSKKERGEWLTKKAAQGSIKEFWEIVVKETSCK